MVNKIISVVLVSSFLAVAALAQLSLPRESTRQEIAQVVGDTKISIVYHRPNAKGRKVFGGLEKYGEVWRTGANENTTFEVSRDVMINGQALPAGKYGFHTIPDKNSWTLIFNKVNNAWGSFTYDAKNDALRIKVVPQKAAHHETMSIGFGDITMNTGEVYLAWEKVRVPFRVDIGDVVGRSLAMIREAIKTRKADDLRPLNQGTGYVLTYKLVQNYEEAMGWISESVKTKEGFGNLSSKARLYAAMGKVKEAIETGEKAVQVGKAATPAADTSAFEKTIAEWKSGKK